MIRRDGYTKASWARDSYRNTAVWVALPEYAREGSEKNSAAPIPPLSIPVMRMNRTLERARRGALQIGQRPFLRFSAPENKAISVKRIGNPKRFFKYFKTEYRVIALRPARIVSPH